MKIDEFISNINKRSSVKINERIMDKLIDSIEDRIDELEIIIKELLNINQALDREIKKGLELLNLNTETLIAKFEETGQEVFNKVLELRRLRNKKKSLDIIKESINKGYVKPVFSVSKNNSISLSKPAFNFLTTEEIKDITGFKNYKNFNSVEEILDFLRRYNVVIKEGNCRSSYLIKGTTLYFNYQAITDFYIINKFKDKYLERELYRTDKTNTETLRDVFDMILSECRHITNKNYELFKEIYDKYNIGIQLTKELIRDGEIEEIYYSFFTPDCCIFEEDRLNCLEEDRFFKEKFKRAYDQLVDEMTKVSKEKEYLVNHSNNKSGKKIFQYNIEAMSENLRKRGFSEEHINGQRKRVISWNEGIKKYINSDRYILIIDDDAGEIIADFLFAGKGEAIAVRIYGNRNENGDYIYVLGIKNSPKIIAPKGSLHKRLIIKYPDNNIKEIKGNSKKDNIRNAVTTILNDIL